MIFISLNHYQPSISLKRKQWRTRKKVRHCRMVLSAARLQQDKAAQLQPNMASTTAALLQRHPHHLSVGVSICQSVRFLLLTWRVPALCMIDLGEIFAVNYQPFPAVATWPGAQILTQPATLQHCMQLCRQPGRLEFCSGELPAVLSVLAPLQVS